MTKTSKVRITIMLDSETRKKLVQIQGDQIGEYHKNVSFSEVLNQVLQKGLKNE